MAKRNPALYRNANGADLNLPDGVVIPPGGEIELSDAMLASLGVQMWIDGGLLVAQSAEE